MPCKTTPNLIFWTVAQTGKVTPLVSGPPGCGKSRTIEAFARAMSRQCYTLIGSLREPADVGGYPYPVPGEQPYMAVMPPKWAQDCQHGQWVLFLDELTTCPPAVQAALLGVIAENRVGDAVLPDTVWKLAACNPPDCAANGSELEPPLANRLCHLTWETDTEAWQRGMGNALGFPQPSFVPLPLDWEKYIGRNTGLVGAFHKHKPGLLEAKGWRVATHNSTGNRQHAWRVADGCCSWRSVASNYVRNTCGGESRRPFMPPAEVRVALAIWARRKSNRVGGLWRNYAHAERPRWIYSYPG